MKTSVRLFAPFFLFLVFVSARGQDYTSSYGYTFNNPISATCNSLLWDKMNARLTYRHMLKKRGYTDAQLGQMSTDQMLSALGGKTAAQSEAQKSLSGNATTFRPAPGRLLLPAMAKSLVKDREQQKALLEIFEAGIRAYEKEAALAGFVNDVAGAMVFLIGASYYVYHNGQEPDENGTELIGRALQQSLNTPEFRQIPDSDKQKFYELMIGLGTYLGVAFQQAVSDNDAEMVNRLKEAAADALKGFLKLDPATVRITSTGLEITARNR